MRKKAKQKEPSTGILMLDSKSHALHYFIKLSIL